MNAQFGSHVFHRGLIEKLPKKVAQNWLDILDGKAKLDPAHADEIADALKNWAIKQGATHFTHWFHPLANVEKKPLSREIERFRGKELLRREIDGFSGYTSWDPTMFPFLWEGVILCIPAFFFSSKGEALDHKIPLLRSEDKLNQVVLALLKLCGVPAGRVYSTLGIEQEYFLIDRSLFLLRPDLLLAGRTVFGAPGSKEQGDSRPKDRIGAYLRELEEAALRLGIPVKTRQNEAATSLFERATLAVDHNLLLMELMRQIALKHDLACLLHEKPFLGIHGSGKCSRWSLVTDMGLDLLDSEKKGLLFAAIRTAVLRAAQEHAALLWASTASAGNDLRGNPTPFFAFTGNHFELRAVGSSAHCGFPIAVLNAIVADSLQLILDEIADVLKDRKLSGDDLLHAALPVLHKHLKAEACDLPNKSFYAFAQLLERKTLPVFEGILTSHELSTYYEAMIEQYVKTMNLEVNLMIDLFQTGILPAVQKETILRDNPLIDDAIAVAEELKKLQSQTLDLGWEAKGRVFCELIAPKMEEMRKKVDSLEMIVDNALWPLPKYRELLFLK